MKKKSYLFRMMACLVCCLMSFASLSYAQTTYIFSNYPAGNPNVADEEHALDDVVTIYTTRCNFASPGLRVYANNGLFYSNALPYYIDSLSFYMMSNEEASVASVYGRNTGDTVWTLIGTIPVTTATANLGISFGNSDYQYFKFAAGVKQIRMTSMTIYYKPNGPGGIAAQAPTFSPSSGVYTAPVSVTLASTTDNASIYYTLDGTIPTTSSTLYSNPITISQTTTVKAIATASGYMNSSVASATYNFPETVANLAAFKAMPNSDQTYYKIGSDVTFVFGSGPYTYVKDASAGLLLYGDTAIATDFTEGEQIANLMGTRAAYNGQIEMKNLSYENSQEPSIGPVNPIVLTISELRANYAAYDAQLVTFENVTFPNGFAGASTAFYQGTDSIVLFNRFGIDTTLAANTVINVTGFAAKYGSTIQIYPRNNSDLSSQAPALTPSLSITAPANGSNFSTFDTLPIGIDIQNFTLGTDGYLKVETPLLTTLGFTNPVYLDQTGLNMLLAATLSPLPAGTHTITCSLVDMNHVALNPAVNAATTFTVTAPVLAEPMILIQGNGAEDDLFSYYFDATIIMMADEGAAIYYTTDSTEPTTASTLYTGPFQITTTTTIMAIAVKEYWQNSPVATVTVTITAPTVETPTFMPGAGTYADSVTFSIDCATDDVVIRYTTDGTEPTENSLFYISPVTLTTTTTVKAKAFKIDWFTSATATADYVVVYDPVLTVDAPTLNFTSTTLAQTFTVSGAHLDTPITLACDNTHFTVNPTTISDPNSNTTVTVTFDGTEPATGTITVTSDTLTVQVALAATAQLPAPVLTSDTDNDTMVTVTMSCAVSDAAIRYTTDGTEPTATSQLYSAPVVLNTPGTYTLKAIAMKADWENSNMVTGTYTVVEPSVGDIIVYTVGFEAEEGFAASNVYNNTTVAFTGPDNLQWGTYYGTPSTNNHIAGGQSMQMRWYTSATENIGYTYTNFDLRNVTHVTFTAANSNGLNVKVSHSIDGGSTYSAGETFALTGSAQNFDYVVDEAGTYDYVRLKFTIVLPETAPTATSRVVIDSVVVYGIPGVTPTTVSAPVITPNEGYYYTPQTVSITCAEVDAVIRYTTDGSVPTETSTIYNAPFTVNTTTTIRAKAWKTGMTPSFVSSVTVSFPDQVANIAAFKANASSAAQQIMSDVTFVFRSGNYMFVEDNSAALMIYDNATVITTEYNEGDVIQGGIFGSYQLYNGMVELIPSHNANAATGTPVTVTPTVATVANVKSQYANVYESKLVRLNDVQFVNAEMFVQNGDTMSIRNRFNTVDMEINAGDHADITGFVSYSTSYGYQIYPRDNNDIDIHPVVVMDTVATPVFNVYKSGEFYFMNLTCATGGASIYYTFDGTDPDENDDLFTSDQPLPIEPLTLKAIAMKEGMVNSAVAVYEYNPVGINTYDMRRNIHVYPNPVVDVMHIDLKDKEFIIEQVDVFNMFGQLVHTVQVGTSSTDISVGMLVTGNYIVKITTNRGVVNVPVIKK